MNAPRARPYVLIAVAGVLWGATFPLARIATSAGAKPLGFAFWQGLLGGLVLLVMCAATRRRPRLAPDDLKRYLLLGLIGTALPAALFFHAAPHVPSGVLAITVATVPLMTYGASCVLGVDRIALSRLAGIAAGFGAIGLIVLPGASLPNRAMVPWVLLVLVSALSYTVENLYVSLKVPTGTDMLALPCGMLFASALMLAPIVLATDQLFGLGWPWSVVEASTVAMAVASSVAYAIFLHVIHLAGPVFASQTGYVVTATGVLWGMVLLGERHSGWVWGALVLVLVGLAMVTPVRRAVRG